MVQGRLSATTQTLVGDTPVYSIDTILPPLLKRLALPDQAYIYMLSEISYADINAIVNQALSGRVFNIADHRIKIQDAEVWGCGPILNLRISVKGDVKGDIYFQ